MALFDFVRRSAQSLRDLCSGHAGINLDAIAGVPLRSAFVAREFELQLADVALPVVREKSVEQDRNHRFRSYSECQARRNLYSSMNVWIAAIWEASWRRVRA